MYSLWRKFANWASQREVRYLYRIECETAREQAAPVDPELEIVLITRENIGEVQTRLQRFPDWIDARVQRGEIAAFAIRGAEWIFCGVMILGPCTFRFLAYPFPLLHTDAMVEGLETIPSWRGKGVAPAMLGVMARYLRARGINTIYLTVKTDNAPSCRAIEKVGGRRVGLLRAHMRFGCWVTNLKIFPLNEDERYSTRLSQDSLQNQ